MSKIVSVGTSVPPYVIDQVSAKQFSRNMFKEHFSDIDRLMKLFENTNIEKRHFCVPMEWFEYEHSFEEKNIIYVKNAIELSKQALLSCLDKTAFSTEDIDHIFFISSTGISTPSIDAFLFNDPELTFSAHIKRTPIFGLGCAGGAAGISRAMEYTMAYPYAKALVIALEIGELAFLKNDPSKSNLVATSLFADGAAAVLVIGDEIAEQTKITNTLSVLDSQSTIWDDKLDVMGWDVQNEGFKVIFSRDIPSIIKNDLVDNIEHFLKKHQLTLMDIEYFVLHPGGAKVIDAYEKSLHIDQEKTFATRKILSEYGNMSSPTVLFVLKEMLEHQQIPKGYGVMLALGPGFSSEIVLLKKD